MTRQITHLPWNAALSSAQYAAFSANPLCDLIHSLQIASVIGTLAVIAFGAPVVLLMIIPLGFAYRSIMRYYLATSRELKRLDAVSRSPVFTWFGETLSGVSTIRAYGQQARFIANNEARLDRNMACYMPAQSVNRWLAVSQVLNSYLTRTHLNRSAGPARVFGSMPDVCRRFDFGRCHARLQEAGCRVGRFDHELRHFRHRKLELGRPICVGS